MAKDDDFYGDMEGFRTGFAPGEKVRGTITGITSNSVFVDLNAKSEGIIERSELVDREGKLTVSEGEEIEAFFARMDRGDIVLTVRMATDDAEDADIRQAFDAQIPVEGKVQAERKGGYEVRFGETRGFCPFSQMDVYAGGESSAYVGQRLTFLITEYDGDNLVVSRRKLLEAQAGERKDKLKGQLAEGDTVEGTVTRVMNFGAFVDLGGMEGLIPMGELAWERVERAEDVVKAGDRVTVRVLRLDWARDRVSLSLRLAGGDPWDTIDENFHVGGEYRGKVTRCMDFGAFVQLTPGVEGLVHISKLGAGKRLAHAHEVVQEGQELAVFIEKIDHERRRISLVLENPQQGRHMEVAGAELVIGSTVKGTVEDIRPFGIFVKVGPNQTGLLHISQLDIPEHQTNPHRAMYKMHPPGSEIEVEIQAVHQRKISLTLPNRGDDESASLRELLQDGDGDGLGSLGGLFDGFTL